jgi:hypothetical protein
VEQVEILMNFELGLHVLVRGLDGWGVGGWGLWG